MATIRKKSVLRTMLIASFMVSFSFLFSCKNGSQDGVWIPNPPDTSALGKIDHFIPLEQIREYQANARVVVSELQQLAPNVMIPASEAFNKNILLDILKDPKSVGIRIYYGAKTDGQSSGFRLVLVGVDEQGNDLYVTKPGSKVAAQAGRDPIGGGEYGQCNPPCSLIPPTP